MAELEPVLKAIDFIEANLQQPLCVADAAAAAGYSLFHFCRLFSQVTRLTPYEYIMRRRLTQAAAELGSGSKKVLQVALEYQFGSAEGFARAFKRVFDLQPHQIRRGAPVDPRLGMPRLDRSALEHLQSLPLVASRQDFPACELVGLMRSYADQAVLREALWRDLFSEVGVLLLDQKSSAAYGVLLYSSQSPVRPYYFFGLPTTALQHQPDALVLKRLSGGDCACFDCSHPGMSPELTQSYLFSTWLPHNSGTRLPPFLIEQFSLPALISGDQCLPARILLPLNWSN